MEPQSEGRTPPRRRRRAVWLLALVLPLALIAGATAVVVATPWGLRAAKPFVAQAIGGAVEGTAEIGDLEGTLWHGFRAAQVSIEGAEGLSVRLEGLRFDWTPTALLQGVLRIDLLAANRLAVTLPAGGGAEEAPSEPGLPQLPVAIRLGRLDVAELALRPEPGAAVKRLKISGDLALAQDRGGTAELHVTPLDATGDRLDARAEFKPAGGTLALDVDLRAAADGMLWSLAGVPAAEASDARLKLAGSGPLAEWTGSLRVEAARYGSLESDLVARYQEGRPFGLELDGALQPAHSLLPTEFAELLDTARFRVAGRLDGAETAVIESLSLQLGEAASIEGRGTVGLAAGTLDVAAEAALAPALAGRLDPGLAWRTARLQAEATGPLDAPVVALDAELVDVAYGGIEAARLTARLEPEDAAMERFLVRLEAAGAAWGEATLDRLLGSTLTLVADGRRAGELLAFRDVQLDAGRLTASGEADVDAAEPRVTGVHLEARVAELGMLPAMQDVLTAGNTTARLDNGSWSPEKGLVGDLKISGEALAFAPEAAAAFVGAAPAATGRVHVASSGAVTVDGLQLETAGGTLAGRAALDAAQRLELVLEGTLAPAALAQVAGIEPADPLPVRLALSGPVVQPTGDLTARWQQLAAPGATLGPGRLGTHLAWTEDGAPVAEVDADAEWRGQQIAVRGRVSAPEGGLQVEDLVLSADDMRLSGTLRLPDYALPATGKLQLRDFDLALLQPFTGQDLAGEVSGDVTLAARKGAQALDGRMVGQGIRWAPEDGPAVSLARAEVEAEVADLFGTAGGRARVTVSDLARDGVQIRRLQADLSGGLASGRADFRVDAASPAGNATGTVEVAEVKAGRRFTLTALEGTLADRSFALLEPSTVTLPTAGGIELNAAFRAEDGRVRVAYETGGRRTVADLEIERFPLAILPPLGGRSIAAGRLDAMVHLEEAGSDTTGRATVRLDEVALSAAEDLPPLSASMEASLSRGTLDAGLTLDVAAIKEGRATAAIPVNVSLANNRFALAEQGPVKGMAALRGNLQDIWPYLPFPTHKLEGVVDAEATVGGSVDRPSLAGQVALERGRYENLEWGTLLKDIAGLARFTDQRLVIERLNATDGKRGRVTVSGETLFGGEEGLRYDFAAEARRLLVVRRDDLSATASADLSLKGAGDTGELTGKATVTGAEIDLNVALPPSVPTLDVTRASAAPAEADGTEERQAAAADSAGDPPSAADPSAGGAIVLDIAVDIPGQVYARGRRVDSEWEGDLTIKGTLGDPRIYGDLGVKRGTFGLLSKELRLDDTEITFQGRSPINPDLAVRAVHEDKDLRAVINVDGTAKAPKVSLTSTPSLPREEILSRILFGKSRGKLSAIEAAQLAAALSELRGGGGVDVLGTLRNVVGLDRLSVGSNAQGEAQVEVGRYLTDQVYVGAKQGAEPGSGGVEVEVEVTPNVSVTSETGQSGESNVGVNFKWDY